LKEGIQVYHDTVVIEITLVEYFSKLLAINKCKIERNGLLFKGLFYFRQQKLDLIKLIKEAGAKDAIWSTDYT